MLDRLPPPAEPGGMLAYFRGQRVVGPGRRLLRLEEVEPGTPMASYDE